MKRITIYIAHLLVLVLTGCDKTVLEFPENEGVDPTLVNANLSLAIDPKIEPYEQTGRSEGEVIDAYDVRWIVEVFRDEIGGELAERRVLGCEPAADGPHTIHTSLALHAARYHVVAWMDYVDNGSVDDKYYTIPSLSSISVPAAGNYIGDEDHKDTYVARQEIDLKAHRDRWNETVDVTVTLQRPMAKIEFIATDIDKFLDELAARHSEITGSVADDLLSQTPDLSTIRVQVDYAGYFPSGFNAYTNKPNEDGYRMAVYAYGDAKVNIYGGNFVNDQDYNDHNAQLDLIYADQQAVINIYGGTFESKSANNRGYWVLNLKDGSGAAINVYGGTFINYDPSSSMTENPVKNFVAEGYTAIKTSAEPAPNGTYTVVKGTEVAAPADLESALKSGDIAIVSRSMTIDDSPYISSVASATLSLKEGAVLTAQEGSELQQCIQVSKSCKKMVISGKGFIVGPKNSTATNVAGIYSGCPDLVIDGTITVDGSSGSKGTNAAIRIAEGTTTIKDGYFTVGTDASGIANSCILVATARPSQKAHLKIYGGVFETKGNPINGWYPVINIQDADRKAGRATVEIYGGIFINYNPATGDNTGEADDTFVAPGYKSVETTYNGQQAWQVIPE